MKRLHVVKPADVVWPFGREPEIELPAKGWRQREKVDPTPAYGHDLAVVESAIELVERAWPLPEAFGPDWIVLPVDTPARTNGWTSRHFDYTWKNPDGVDQSQAPWRAYIALAGKLIPPHPAVTRYLVAHEYGHVVRHWLDRVFGYREESDQLYREYAKLRGLPRRGRAYGAGAWHAAVSEIFANDFRIVVTGVELEYWPHPGVPRPTPEIVAWWHKRAHEHAGVTEAAA